MVSTSNSSDNGISLEKDLLTIEEINELFKKQIKKLEESTIVEVNILVEALKHENFFSRKKQLRILIENFKLCVLNGIKKNYH